LRIRRKEPHAARDEVRASSSRAAHPASFKQRKKAGARGGEKPRFPVPERARPPCREVPFPRAERAHVLV
jgi:hypothetical protein